MSNVVNFKEKYVQTLLEEIEDAEDATDVISIQRKYRVSIELQNLFREFIGQNFCYYSSVICFVNFVITFKVILHLVITTNRQTRYRVF